jgi:nitrogen fixation protein FixH
MHGKSALGHELTGRYVLLGLVTFFGVMLLANGIFVYYALGTFAGGDTSDPYRKGLHYNDTLAEAAAQDARGWRIELSYDRRTGQLSLLLHDKEGQALRGLAVASTLGRPATDKNDVTLKLVESDPGVYSGGARLANGQWLVTATVEDPAAPGAPYRLKQRLFIPETP